MLEVELKALLRLQPDLVQKLDVKLVIDMLISYGVICNERAQYIMMNGTTPQDKVRRLLDALQRSDNLDTFDVFLVALQKPYPVLFKVLLKECYGNISEQDLEAMSQRPRRLVRQDRTVSSTFTCENPETEREDHEDVNYVAVCLENLGRCREYFTSVSLEEGERGGGGGGGGRVLRLVSRDHEIRDIYLFEGEELVIRKRCEGEERDLRDGQDLGKVQEWREKSMQGSVLSSEFSIENPDENGHVPQHMRDKAMAGVAQKENATGVKAGDERSEEDVTEKTEKKMVKSNDVNVEPAIYDEIVGERISPEACEHEESYISSHNGSVNSVERFHTPSIPSVPARNTWKCKDSESEHESEDRIHEHGGGEATEYQREACEHEESNSSLLQTSSSLSPPTATDPDDSMIKPDYSKILRRNKPGSVPHINPEELRHIISNMPDRHLTLPKAKKKSPPEAETQKKGSKLKRSTRSNTDTDDQSWRRTAVRRHSTTEPPKANTYPIAMVEAQRVVVHLRRGDCGTFGFGIIHDRERRRDGTRAGSECWYITHVTPGSPADVSGRIHEKDSIVSIDGNEIKLMNLDIVLSYMNGRQEVKLELRKFKVDPRLTTCL